MRPCIITEDPDRQATTAQDLHVAQLDAVVAEFFELMLQLHCVPSQGPSTTGNTISAKIVFSGSIEAHCIVSVSTGAANRLTRALLRGSLDWDDRMVDDAVGELCNIIAGGWKSRLGAQASLCKLSVPAVSRSQACETTYEGLVTTRRFYAFDDAVLEVSLSLT